MVLFIVLSWYFHRAIMVLSWCYHGIFMVPSINSHERGVWSFMLLPWDFRDFVALFTV